MSIHDLTDHARVVAGIAASAVEGGRVVGLHYKGEARTVEVHAVGVSTAMRPVIRGFDLNKKSWRLFAIDDVEDIFVSGAPSMAPRVLEGYKPGDKAMVEIFTEVTV